MPAQIDTAAAFLAEYDEPIPPPIVAVMHRAANAAFTPDVLAAHSAPSPPVDPPSPRVLLAIDHFRAAQAQAGQTATAVTVDASVATLASSLPNVALRSEQGLTALRMWVVLGTVAHKLPKQMVDKLYATPARVASGMPELMAWTRSTGEGGGGYPAMTKARDAAIAENIAALGRISPDDVRTLAAYYTSPAGRAQTAAVVEGFRAANDAAASAAITAFYPEAVKLVAQY